MCLISNKNMLIDVDVSNNVTLKIIEDPNLNVLHITGTVNNSLSYTKMVMFAANPIDRLTTYSGSGLPFPNNQIAFENSPNYYEIPSLGEINDTFFKPNSYYSYSLERVPPTIFVKLTKNQNDSIVQFKLVDPLPLKTLFYRNATFDPSFYQKRSEVIGVQSQYNYLLQLQNTKELSYTG